MSLKSELICRICQLVLNNSPISLPCSHDVCSKHLRDGTVKQGSIRCAECYQKFDVPCKGFPANKIASDILEKELHLSDEEKTIKISIQETIQQLERLQFDLKQKHSDLERISVDHFSEVRRQIDFQREELKRKIDEIALKLLEQVNEKEKVYVSTMQQSFLAATSVNIEESRRILANKFRSPNLVIAEVKCLQTEHERKIADIRTRLDTFDSVGMEIKSLVFKPSQDASFGILKTDKKNELMAFTADKKIIMWDMVSKHSVATLQGHSAAISCLECIDENRFASGSYDRTIKIWDSINFVCLKTLPGHLNAVMCLKTLTSNRIASGSSGDIKIWNRASGECLQIIDAHLSWITGLVALPNGNLVSCSWDKTIKLWDLVRGGKCLKTLTGHSNWICCIILLRNGLLASGCYDNTIRIWNVERGVCVKAFRGYSNLVWRLQQLENGDLVSCSYDNTIDIWNLNEGACIRTLVGHTSIVKSIRVNSQNNTLVSYSKDGRIKIWDLNTDQCIKTIFVKKAAKLWDLILI